MLYLFLDDFGVPSKESEANLYNKYGSSRLLFNNSRFSQYIYTADFGKYAFNGIDLTPESGPRRPFNFFGIASMVRPGESRSLSTSLLSHIQCCLNHGELSFLFLLSKVGPASICCIVSGAVCRCKLYHHCSLLLAFLNPTTCHLLNLRTIPV